MMQNKSRSSESGSRRNRKSSASNVRFFSHSTEVFKHHIPTEFVLLGLIELISLIISFNLGIKLRHGNMLGMKSSAITSSVQWCLL